MDQHEARRSVRQFQGVGIAEEIKELWQLKPCAIKSCYTTGPNEGAQCLVGVCVHMWGEHH